LSDTYKQKKIFTIRNGYDPALLDADLFPNKSPNELVISFMGTLYSWHPLEAFLVTLADLLREEKTIKIRLLFWGIHKQEEVIKLVNKNSQHLAGIIEFRPRVENPNLRAIKQQSDLFLLFNDYALIGTKIYDYLALKRCIILCFSEEPNPDKLKPPYVKDFNKGISTMAQAELIEETNSGFVIKSPEHLKETIKRLSIELKMKGLVKCQSRGIEPYSRKVQTQNLARIIFGFKNSNE
jgi:hypothetical protein